MLEASARRSKFEYSCRTKKGFHIDVDLIKPLGAHSSILLNSKLWNLSKASSLWKTITRMGISMSGDVFTLCLSAFFKWQLKYPKVNFYMDHDISYHMIHMIWPEKSNITDSFEAKCLNPASFHCRTASHSAAKRKLWRQYIETYISK